MQQIRSIKFRRFLSIFVTLLVAFSAMQSSAVAATQTLATSSVGNGNSTWKAVFYTPSQTGDHTFTFTKSDPSAVTGNDLRKAQGNAWITSNSPSTGTTQTLTASLAAGEQHKVAFWVTQGSTDYTLTVDAPDAPTGPTTTETISSGIRDNDEAIGPRWVLETWTAPVDGDATFELTWTNPGDLRFNIREQATNQWITTSTLGGTSPQTQTIPVTAGTTYKVPVWATDGWGDHTFTVTYPNTETNSSEPSREVFTGRGDVTGATGNVTTSIPFTAPGNGSVYVSLNYEQDDAELHLFLEDAAGNVIDSTPTVWVAKGIEKLVVPADYTVEVVAANGAADWHMELYYEPTVTTQPDAAPDAPNIVVVNTDDQRADSLQHLPKISNWFVDNGLMFTNGYVTTPSCCPSRAALFTGQYNHNNGVLGQEVPELNQNETVQRALKDAGYNTAFAGKYVHFWPQQLSAPHWDSWTYFKGGYYNTWINSDGDNRKRSENSTIYTFDKGIEYIDAFKAQDDDRPWFLHLTPVVPHKPAIPEPQYENAPVAPRVQTPNIDEVDRSDKPQYMQNRNHTAASSEALRLKMIRSLYTYDDQIDRLMNHLDATGELDNTMVILTSDNGYNWGEHRLTEKFAPYDVSIRVPFLVYWQGKVIPGSTDDRWVANIDVAPTVLAAAGVDIPEATDGVDIFSGYDRDYIFNEYFRDPANSSNIPGWKSVRNDDFVYTEYYELDETTVIFQEYYDLVADPYQLTNLLADGDPNNDPDLTLAQAKLAEHANCAGITCRS